MSRRLARVRFARVGRTLSAQKFGKFAKITPIHFKHIHRAEKALGYFSLPKIPIFWPGEQRHGSMSRVKIADMATSRTSRLPWPQLKNPIPCRPLPPLLSLAIPQWIVFISRTFLPPPLPCFRTFSSMITSPRCPLLLPPCLQLLQSQLMRLTSNCSKPHLGKVLSIVFHCSRPIGRKGNVISYYTCINYSTLLVCYRYIPFTKHIPLSSVVERVTSMGDYIITCEMTRSVVQVG